MPFHPSRPQDPVSTAAGTRPLRWLLVAAATAALVACGGGGDGGGDGGASASAISSAQIPDLSGVAGLPRPSAICTGALRNDVLAYVNAYRAAGATCKKDGKFTTYAPATALQWHDGLEAAARAHSQAMIDTDEFAHEVTGEARLGPRIAAAGYAYASARENIAAGRIYGDVATVVAAWMHSETGHCDNIMAGDLQHVAVACLPGNPTNRYENYWTMDLGRL